MKITAVLPTQDMAGALVDTLKKMGFDRNDMIITDMKKSAQDMTLWLTTLLI